jgi:NAD(P)-dependent dehydrogenase (short-subunit alcohol dehydrogenase family)
MMSDSAVGLPGGRVAIVTGASRGIGAATAQAFADAGAAVVLAARSHDQLRELATGIEDQGGTALVLPTDLADPADIANLVERAVATFGRLDYAFNNAASRHAPPTPLAEVRAEDVERALRVDVLGTFLCLKYEIPAIVSCGGGAIVNMASTVAIQAVGGLGGYATAKHAIIGLTKVAALDYAARGLRVNAIAPGTVLTDQLAASTDAIRKRVAATIPAQRIADPDEIARTVVWLCSPAASFVTGATLVADGGATAGTQPITQRSGSVVTQGGRV